MEDYSQTEHVANRVAFSFQVPQVRNLWCHVTWCPTPYEQVLGFIGPSRKTEVSDDTVIVTTLPQQNILRLQIPMHNSFFVHMFKTHQESSETRLNLWNGEFLFGLDFIMELSSLQKLNTDIN